MPIIYCNIYNVFLLISVYTYYVGYLDCLYGQCGSNLNSNLLYILQQHKENIYGFTSNILAVFRHTVSASPENEVIILLVSSPENEVTIPLVPSPENEVTMKVSKAAEVNIFADQTFLILVHCILCIFMSV